MDSLKFSQRRLALKTMAAVAGTIVVKSARAEQFPSKPIRFIVSAAPGGGTDAMARLISNGLGQSKGWQMIVENVPGAGGNLGMNQVAMSAKDGYTIGMGESSNLIINPYLYTKLPFNAATDLAPIVLVAKVPLVLVVGVNSPYKSVQGLRDAAKEKSLFFASAGNGTAGHLTGELWKRNLGMEMVHVPYKSAAPAMSDVAGGQVDLFFASVTSGLPMIQAGKVHPLVVTASSRSSLLPDVPSLTDVGLKDMEAYVIFGVVASSGTPAERIDALNSEINKVLELPSLRKSLIDLGAEPQMIGGGAAQFSELLQQERTKWSQIVKASGARVD